LSEHVGDRRADTLIHLYVNDNDTISDEFGVPVDEEDLAGRECDLIDPDGGRLRIATPPGCTIPLRTASSGVI
jgi:hypothetical protein